MRIVLTFFILLSFTSCNYFNVKKTSFEEILNEELRAFKWNEVDVFPSFEVCNAIEAKEEKRVCFESTLVENIYSTLSSENIIVTQDIKDTILVQFLISEKGKITIIESKIDSITKLEIPNMEDLLHQSLDSLPKIFPAIKRGQQVKTQFTLPVRIRVN